MAYVLRVLFCLTAAAIVVHGKRTRVAPHLTIRVRPPVISGRAAMPSINKYVGSTRVASATFPARHASNTVDRTRFKTTERSQLPILHAAAPDTVPSSADEGEQEASTVVTVDPKASEIKAELLALAKETKRGFQATSMDRQRAKDFIFDLARFNPTDEPASPYYDSMDSAEVSGNTLAGKWTLVYTDAPDITGLDSSWNPLSAAVLGRIGQECNPPYIKNIIEWRRPEWTSILPFSGNDNSRVLQKVVTSASASPDQPNIVNLKVAGLELETPSGSSEAANVGDFAARIQNDGLIAGLLAANPIDLKGPLNPPFGQFEVLYLDSELRIIKTFQNYLAVNIRIKGGEEWF